LLLLTTPQSAEPADAESPPMWGVAGHFLHTDIFYDHYTEHWRLENTLPLLQQAGLTWVREPVYLLADSRRSIVFGGHDDPEVIEGVKYRRQVIVDYLTQYDEAGVKVLLVCMAAPHDSRDGKLHNEEYFAWFAELVKNHPSVVAVELHNEPNLNFFWRSTPEVYVETYRRGAEVIRAARPDVPLIVGSISSLWWSPGIEWLRKAIDAGVLEYADGVSVHPYNKVHPPEADPHRDGGIETDPDGLQKAIAAFWDLVELENDTGRPLTLWFTELGYSAGSTGLAGIDDEQLQADYLSRLMLLYMDARLQGIPLEAVFWYDLKNDGEDTEEGEHNFGLVSFDNQRFKPAFYAYQSIIRHFNNHDELEPLTLDVVSAEHDDSVKTLAYYRESDGALIVVFWRLNQLLEPAGDFKTDLVIDLGDRTRPSRVQLHQAKEGSEISSLKFSGDGSVLRVPVEVARHASWLEIY
jgi:hypothetical protein